MRRICSMLSAAAIVAAGLVAVPGAASAASPKHYKNCTAMHRKYPHGVGRVHAHDHSSSGHPVTRFYRNNALYAANSSLDRDHDHVACEA